MIKCINLGLETTLQSFRKQLLSMQKTTPIILFTCEVKMNSEIDTTTNRNQESTKERPIELIEKHSHFDYELCKKFIFTNQTLVPSSKMWEISNIKC